MPQPPSNALHTAFRGCLLGTAVGDAIGLPREGLSRARAAKRFGQGPLEHALFLNHGMVSDDTEHACMAAQASIASGGGPERFARLLAGKLRWWLLGAPAGIGFATLRSTLKLWCGVSPHRSGVHSAGNGPAMRAAVLGLYAANNEQRLRDFVRVSTRLTHTDRRAEEGALLVALAAREGFRHGASGISPPAVIEYLRRQVAGEELSASLQAMATFLARQASVEEYADYLGLGTGVTGYMNHTVPVALYAWLRHCDDFRQAVERVIRLGGDTDTTGAIVGALAGTTLGDRAIPTTWPAGLWEWPRTIEWIETLADRVAEAAQGTQVHPRRLFWPGLLPRNAIFAAIVLGHGFRRLGPPY